MKETLAFQIAALYRDFLAFTTGELKSLGLSYGLMPLILYAGKHPGCTQADMTRALKLDWGYSQRSISRLVDSGFMTKEYDGTRSGNCLSLTEKGRQAFDVSHKVFPSWDQTKLRDFSPEETQTLLALLSRLTA